MILNTAFLAFAILCIAGLASMALREHRNALRLRNRLLDSAAALLADGKIGIGEDQFPTLSGGLPDGRRVSVELIADTLVTRRLPQLWLKVTLRGDHERRRGSIGCLARPTGAEFYSLVHDLPEWVEPPQMDAALLMRSDGRATTAQTERTKAAFRALFSDARVKEAVVTPRGVRLVRQAAQGDRGAHLLLRQVRFPLATIPPDLVRAAIEQAVALDRVFGDEDAPAMAA